MSNSKINLPIYQSICFLNSQVLRQVKCLYAVLFEYLSLHDHSFLSFIDYYQLAKKMKLRIRSIALKAWERQIYSLPEWDKNIQNTPALILLQFLLSMHFHHNYMRLFYPSCEN